MFPAYDDYVFEAVVDGVIYRSELLSVKAWLANRAVRIRGDWDPGILDADVLLTANGTVAPDGRYDVEPRSCALKAWWRDMPTRLLSGI
jgi:hypothetical protein